LQLSFSAQLANVTDDGRLSGDDAWIPDSTVRRESTLPANGVHTHSTAIAFKKHPIALSDAKQMAYLVRQRHLALTGDLGFFLHPPS
jgi:hypothetical protein